MTNALAAAVGSVLNVLAGALPVESRATRAGAGDEA
jgi:uncharacterized membrane protein